MSKKLVAIIAGIVFALLVCWPILIPMPTGALIIGILVTHVFASLILSGYAYYLYHR